MAMKIQTAAESVQVRRLDTRKSTRFPQDGDDRIVNGLLLPHISPSFSIPKGGTVFTMGSCFARELEENMTDVRLPTTEISFPEDAVKGRPNSLLNEFNPASMAQRINWAVEGQDTREFNDSLIGTSDLSYDLLLAKGYHQKVDRLLDIRHEIDGVYSSLVQSDVLVLTLGMTEAWKDLKTGHFLNRMPSGKSIRAQPDRYQYIGLDTDTVVGLLAQAIEKALSAGIKNFLLTVSPVPLGTTFFLQDCTISNSESKSTLRCAVGEIVRMFPGKVDYFPSYEIVLSGGMDAFLADNRHVKPHVIQAIMDHMIGHYMVGETAERT